MFNFPTNIRLPGFRVGQTDDQPDQDTGTTPGFAVPANGYDSGGDARQAAEATGPSSWVAACNAHQSSHVLCDEGQGRQADGQHN